MVGRAHGLHSTYIAYATLLGLPVKGCCSFRYRYLDNSQQNTVFMQDGMHL